MLIVRELTKRFGDRTAVDDVSFEIKAGEIYGLLGPNGAGKTTAISMIAGILARDGGQIQVDGIDIDAGPAARARIGIVPQSVTLYTDLNARENLRFWGRMYELRGPELQAAVDRALSAVGLEDRASDVVDTYSGGMQRRLNLAAGILHRPALLILDEPTVGVDPHSRSAIFELVEQLRDQGTALLYTTHYMEEAERLCDRIGIIDDGRLIAEGTRSQLLADLGADVRIDVGLEGEPDLERAAVLARSVEGVRRTEATDGRLQVFADAGPERLPALLSRLLDGGLAAASIEVVEPNLEDVFLQLTGRALRD